MSATGRAAARAPVRPAGLLANTAYLFSSRGLEAMLRGGYGLVLAAGLGPELYGLFSLGMSWSLAFLPLGIWGMSVIVLREIGRGADGPDSRQLMSTTFALRLLTTLLATGLCASLALLSGDAQTQAVGIGFALALMGRACALWANDILVARGTARLVFQLQSPIRIGEVAVGIALLALGGGLWGVLVLHILCWWLQAGLGLLVVLRQAGPWWPKYRPGPLWKLFRRGLVTTVLGLANTWLLMGILILAAHGLADPHALGQLALAQQVYMLALTLVGSLAATSLPAISDAAAKPGGNDGTLVARVLKLSVVYGATAAVVVGGVAPSLLGWLLGEPYLEAGSLVGAYLWLLPLDGITMAQSQLLLARRRDRAATACSVAGALAMTGIILPSISALGPVGAILAAAAGRLVRGLCASVLLQQDPTANDVTSRAALLLALLFCCHYGLGMLMPMAAPYATGLLLLVGWWVWLLNVADRTLLMTCLRRLPTRGR